MNKTFTSLALCAAVASLLAACGGGGSDAPDSSDRTSAVALSEATTVTLNGAYGSTETGISDVNELQDVGGDKCDFSFNNVVKVGDSSTVISGNVTYNENASTLALTTFTINGAGYSMGSNGDDTTVDRASNRVTFNGKLFTAIAGGTGTFKVTGYLPMKGNRPSGC